MSGDALDESVTANGQVSGRRTVREPLPHGGRHAIGSISDKQFVRPFAAKLFVHHATSSAGRQNVPHQVRAVALVVTDKHKFIVQSHKNIVHG